MAAASASGRVATVEPQALRALLLVGGINKDARRMDAEGQPANTSSGTNRPTTIHRSLTARACIGYYQCDCGAYVGVQLSRESRERPNRAMDCPDRGIV
jgi:hypothetical protein